MNYDDGIGQRPGLVRLRDCVGCVKSDPRLQVIQPGGRWAVICSTCSTGTFPLWAARIARREWNRSMRLAAALLRSGVAGEQ